MKNVHLRLDSKTFNKLKKNKLYWEAYLDKRFTWEAYIQKLYKLANGKQ